MSVSGPDREGLTDPDLERVRQAVHDSPTAEVAVANGDRPRTFPMSPFYDGERDVVVVTSPPAFAGKVDAVRENPKLSLSFYDADEPFVCYGRGRVVDEDLEGNAEYVGELARREPASEKRAGFSETRSLLESRVGRFLFGWYALRIVVEVEPVAVEPIDGDSGALPPWPERGVDRAEAESYDRVSLTVVDDSGWPVTRSVADVDVRGAAAHLDVPADVAVDDGRPACLLCHWHAQGLEKLGQRLFRGRCREGDGRGGNAGPRVAFEPSSDFAMRNETALDRLRFVIEGKRRTRAYFSE